MNLLQMSFSGAILILAVIVVRAVSINKLPKRTFLVLWGIVLLRLLIPVSVPSILSVYSLVNRSMPVREIVSDVPGADFTPAAQAGQLFISSDTAQAKMPQGVQDNMHVSVRIIIWCVGTISCAAFFIISYLRWSFEFKTSLPVSDTFITQWLEEHRLKRPVTIRQSDRVETPLTYGILHPVILMPGKTDWENKQQLQYILLHEYVHICRFDLAAKLISAFALCIHWFNPMVWVMYILFNRDIELACDECVIRKFGEGSKSEYAYTLINMEEKKSGLMPICNNFSKNAIEERITAVMKIKKTSFAAIIAAVAIVASVTTVFATSAIKDKDDKKETEISVTDFSDDKQSAEIPDADFTDEEYDKLRALQFAGYEGMSVSEYQNKVWELTNTVEYKNLLERFSKSEKLYGMKDNDETAYFLFYILDPLTAEGWQSKEFGGYAAADYPEASNNATIEYLLTLEILDADELTVGEYDVSRRIAVEELNHILDGMTTSDLRDAEYMQTFIDEAIDNINYMAETGRLNVEIQYEFAPLGELAIEDMEEYQKERQKEMEQLLAPYVPFGLTYEYDFATDDYKMYFEGKEVKSIYDENAGKWIAMHSGTGEGIYADNAINLFVVYENGEMAGLSEDAPQEHHDESVTVTNVSFVSGMGCSDPNCTDASHHHDCPINCGDYEHHHNCGLDCTVASHHHAYTEHEQEHHDESVTVTNVSFVSGMGCSDPNCTDASHHHDCPINCGDYEHHHNCGLDCTIASHHHSGASTASGTTQHHQEQHHRGNHH